LRLSFSGVWRVTRFGTPHQMSVSTKYGLSEKSSLGSQEDKTYAREITDNLEDSALMLRYQDGDIVAFEALYHRHNDSLYRYLLRLSLNHATAEDLFQEA
jgi:hypothetical protein